MLLEINNLSVQLNSSTLINKACLCIERGQCVALIGPSGCGKTTLARAILRLQENAHLTGEIIFEDQDLIGLDEKQLCAIRGGKIAMIFQEPMSALNPLHTIGKQIMESLVLHKKTATKKRVLELLTQMELKNPLRIFKSFPHELSGGERQRAMIAMALAGDPSLLIADEPTTALDTQTQNQILTLLKKLQTELNLAILFITHDLDVIKQITDKIYIMENGLVSQGMPEQQNDLEKPLSLSEYVPILQIQDLNISYGKNHIIKNFSLTLNQGETVGLVGPSGSGKSSIGLALTRLTKATGKVILEGQDFLTLKGKLLKKARAQMQMVFQDPFSSLNPRWMIRDIILEGSKIHHLTGLETHLSQVLNQVHLNPDILTRYPHELSGGQRVRVALARALILKPKVLILDEITTQLDIHTQKQILALLKNLQQTQKLSYLFITHDTKALQTLAHRIITLAN